MKYFPDLIFGAVIGLHRGGQGRLPRFFLCLALCVGLIVPAAGGAGAEASQVVTKLVSDDTAVTLFVRGRDRTFQPVGELGTITPGPPRKATILFRNVPEGQHVIDFVGYSAHAFLAPNPAGFPAEAYCVRDFGEETFNVVSGSRRDRAMVETISTSVDCSHTGFDRYTVSSSYAADPTHQFFGSAAGDNIVAVYFDNWGASAQIDVNVNTSSIPASFGLFANLPDTGSGETWPDQTVWNFGTLPLTANADGDARCYLVVKPQARPVLWEIAVENRTRSESARILVWISGPAAGSPCSGVNCDDGNPCTTDACDPIAGCTHTSLPDFTTCGDGLVCYTGACVPDIRLSPSGSLTGDCSNDGTATTVFAQMRCGNSVILGDPPLEVQRYPALTFDLSALAPGVQIESAHVYLYQEAIYGNGPYVTAGMLQVVAEQVRYTTLYGGCDVWTPIEGTIGQALVSDTAQLGWRSADITEAVRYGLEATPRQVQIRLRFVPNTADGDGADDMAVFASDNSTTPERGPFLFLRYASP